MPRTAAGKGKTVFVTVGTTLFEALIDAVTNASVLEKLQTLGFTKLVIQYGKGKQPSIPDKYSGNNAVLQVEMYNFKPSLTDDLVAADWIVGHAGAGTVSETLAFPHKKLVVVINTALMHNHQSELAQAMGDRDHLYVVEQPQDLFDRSTWDKIASFVPIPLQTGDAYDFPGLLNAFINDS